MFMGTLDDVRHQLGYERRMVLGAVDTIVCLVEKTGIMPSDSGEGSENETQFGGRIEPSL
jgi:hypothetical protein